MEHRIAIIGAGAVGSALAATLTGAGYRVRLGVKPGSDPSPAVARSLGRAEPASVPDAVAWADVAFLAVPAAAAVEAATGAGPWGGKVLVDCTNPVAWENGPILVAPPEGSVSAALAAALPDARVVKAFNTFGAEIHGDPSLGGRPAEVLIASDDERASETVGEIASRAGFAPVSAGGLRNAALLEAMAVLWIHLATVGGQGRQFSFALARR
jgi:hypothetical protein